MELRRYAYLIRRRLLLVVVTVLVGAIAGYFSTSKTTLYRTQSVLYVGSLNFSNDPGQLYLETQLNQVLTTFATMIPSSVIAEKAIVETGVHRDVGTVVGETKAEVVTGTNLLAVTVTDRDPVVAQKLANGMSQAFVTQVQTYASQTSPSGSPPSSAATTSPGSQGVVPFEPAYIFESAGLPVAPLSSGLIRKVLLGGVFGLIASVLLVLLLDYLDVTVRSPEELERRLGLPALGVIPLSSAPQQGVPFA